MTEQEEKKKQKIALITSVGVHGFLLLLLFFIIAWKAPNPPLPEYGIELNFGLDDQGTGTVQPQTPVGTQAEQPEELAASPEETTSPEESEQDDQRDAEPTETKTVEPEVTSKTESPVEVKEKKEEIKPEVPKEKPVDKSVSEKKTESKPKEDPKAVYQPNNKATTQGTATEKEGEPGNQGDSQNKTGDKGDPEGSLDAKALYGKQGGGGGGPSLQLAGWNWDKMPDPKVSNNESGRVVFEIKVDQNGDIISIRTIERSASLEAEQICRAEVQKLTFSKTGSNVPETSTGRITFVIRSK